MSEWLRMSRFVPMFVKHSDVRQLPQFSKSKLAFGISPPPRNRMLGKHLLDVCAVLRSYKSAKGACEQGASKNARLPTQCLIEAPTS